ncbi:MAG: mechanosensitive ion channel family protein [Cyanobacteria bacterium SID2]|nr:mechanosensitive ion channel family protein [Cyanobacteria bacterium SID2]MBP0004948.1 mechanosensitive ion channel family protein [Cyanobacteria bacterium SBC]
MPNLRTLLIGLSHRVVRLVFLSSIVFWSIVSFDPRSIVSPSPLGSSVWAQAPLPLPTQTPSRIESAPVRLNGLTVFEIASRKPTNAQEKASIPPVDARVAEIESILNSILEQDIDPDTLRVYSEILNNQPILLVEDQQNLSPRPVMTVTEVDAEFTKTTVDRLAKRWTIQLEEALIEAWKERQPQARQKRLKIAFAIGAGVLVLSPVVLLFQRFLKQRYTTLNDRRQENDLTSLDATTEPNFGTATWSFQFLSALMPKIQLERRINIVVLLRRFLLWLQISLWMGGLIGILYQFPKLRPQALWLSDFPIQILTIWLVVATANKVSDITIDGFLKSWVERESVNPRASKRFVLRAPTLAAALKGMTSFVAGLVGFIWFLALQNAPIDSLLTGAGIFGVALTIVFQNLIKDFINGILILWEDQFAVGDVIDVGYGTGLVEYMNLRITRIRGEGGRLTTIPNSQINVVHNLTKEWSRVDFRIRVTHDTDVMTAVRVMKQVAADLQADIEWAEQILEPTMLIGVDRIDESGIEILMWMKTKPLQQWNVEREYRRRLKLAFDEQGIQIGIPQQTMLMKK